MARIDVEYTVTVKQTIDWPDDELDDLNYDNLMANLDPSDANDLTVDTITGIKKDGKNHDF